MAEPKKLVCVVSAMGFATKPPKDEDDLGKGLMVKLTIEIDLMQPEAIKTLAEMQNGGHVTMTLLQEQLALFGG